MIAQVEPRCVEREVLRGYVSLSHDESRRLAPQVSREELHDDHVQHLYPRDAMLRPGAVDRERFGDEERDSRGGAIRRG